MCVLTLTSSTQHNVLDVIVACLNSAFLFIAGRCSMVQIYHSLTGHLLDVSSSWLFQIKLVWGWACGSRSRAPTYQVQSPEFKPPYCQKISQIKLL
jgi:hypothetical protein